MPAFVVLAEAFFGVAAAGAGAGADFFAVEPGAPNGLNAKADT